MPFKLKQLFPILVLFILVDFSHAVYAAEFCVVNTTSTDVNINFAQNTDAQFIKIDPSTATLNKNGTSAICARLMNPGYAPPIWPSITAQFTISEGYVMQLIICDPSLGPLDVYFNTSLNQNDVNTTCGSPNVGFAGRSIGEGLYVNSVQTGNDGVYRVIITNE